MVQKTHTHQLTRHLCPYQFYPLNASTEMRAFTLLAMFGIQYLTNKWTYTCVVLKPNKVHVLKQCVKIGDV